MDGSSDRATVPDRRRDQVAKARGAGGGPAEMGNALEMLRIVATILVVLYHSSLTYLHTPLRLTLWAVYDHSSSSFFDLFAYWVNGFAMPVFFLAAGVSAPGACESRGPRAFLSARASRLLRPLFIIGLPIVPISYLVWGYGLTLTGRCTIEDILAWRFGPEVTRHVYGFGHLWFLEYMFLVCVLWCACWWAVNRIGPLANSSAGPIRRVLASPWRPVLFAIPTALIFLIDSDTMLRVDNAVVPNACRLIHYTWFFAVGGWISRVDEPRRQFSGLGVLYLTLSFVVYAVMSPLLLQHAAAPLHGGSRVVYCLLAAFFPWLTVFGGLGVFLRYLPPKGAVVRFLSVSSFWVYIVHVPIVAVMQIALLSFPWPTPVKFVLVSVVALGLSLLSYVPLVKYSLLGEVLYGTRKRVPKGTRLSPEFGWVATFCVLALFFGGEVWSLRGFLMGSNYHAIVGGRLYRSARLTPKELDDVIRREGVRSVLTFNGGEQRPWYHEQQVVCERRHAELHTVTLYTAAAPSRAALLQVIDLLGRCPRPVLVEARRGIDQVAFASAVELLLAGSSPTAALAQFDLKYGQFGGAKNSSLGVTLIEYQHWLAANRRPHSPQQLRDWASNAYVGRSAPVVAEELSSPPARLATGSAATPLAR